MDISSLTSITGLTGITGTNSTSNLSNLSKEDITSIYSARNDALSSITGASEETTGDFSSILSSMLSSLDETNTLQNQAEEAEIQFALGEMENTHGSSTP